MPKLPHCKRRWTDEEHHLIQQFSSSITNGKIPGSSELQAFCKQIKTRTLAQVRSQIHNFIRGKTNN